MVEIADIRDRESLEAWLKDKPPELAISVAYRTTARVMPFYWAWAASSSNEVDTPDIAMWRIFPISQMRSLGFSHEVADAADAAYRKADTARSSAGAADDATRAAALAALYTALAATAANAPVEAAHAADAAAKVASAALWHAIRWDAAWLATGDLHLPPPLWTDSNRNGLLEKWAEAKAALPPGNDWRFWIDWYEAQLNGTPMNWEMLRQIVLIPDADWKKGATHVNPIIWDIYQRYLRTDQDGIDLFVATLFDFTYDELEHVMRAVPMPDDWKLLEDAERLAAFLEDATDLRDDLELMCNALAAEGRAMQGAGGVRTYADAVLSTLQKAEEFQKLRVDKLMEYGRILEGATRDEDTLREFGPLAEALKLNAEKLRALIRNHFAHTLARMSVLRDIHLEEDALPWQVLNEFRDIVAQVKTGGSAQLPPLAAQDAAVLTDVLDSVDVLIRSMEAAQSEEAKSSFRRDIDFQLAKVGATAGVYRERAAKAKDYVGKGANVADDVIKWNKRWEGLRAFGRAILDLFEIGGGS